MVQSTARSFLCVSAHYILPCDLIGACNKYAKISGRRCCFGNSVFGEGGAKDKDVLHLAFLTLFNSWSQSWNPYKQRRSAKTEILCSRTQGGVFCSHLPNQIPKFFDDL